MSNLTAPAFASTNPATWQLVRIWHVETLSTVAGNANAHRFTRESYCIVPSSWRQLDEQGCLDRILYVLGLSYGARNFQSARSGDPAEMWWVAVGFEFVDEHAMAAREPGDEHDDDQILLRGDRNIHPAVMDGAVADIQRERWKPRAGLEQAPWTNGFSAFRFEQDGNTCHLVKHRERSATFEAAFRSA